MKFAVVLVLAGVVLRAQTVLMPVSANPALSLPGIDGRALTAVVSSSVSPDGQVSGSSDLYVLRPDGSILRKLPGPKSSGIVPVDLSSDGSKIAYSGTEQIHLVDTTSGIDQKVAAYTAGCIQPLAPAICLGCSFSCVRSVHLSPDASRVVYSASGKRPIYVVNADGSGNVNLPPDGAVLAPSPQRVVSRDGLLAFTAGQDVGVINLDGSGMRILETHPNSFYPSSATISEDGKTIAFTIVPGIVTGRPYAEIHILRLDGSPSTTLTSDADVQSSPSISADGSLIAYLAGGQALLQRTDGTAPPARLTSFAFLTATGVSLSGDGSTALVSVGTAIYVAKPGTPAKRLFAPTVVLPYQITSYSGLEPPSPGSLFRITGWNFTDDAISPGGVSVRVNGQAAPVALVTPTRIVAQLPFTTPPGTAKIEVGGASATVDVQSAAPEVLQYVQPFFTSIYAQAFHAGTAFPADQGRPASAGETLEMYGLGLGAVSPPVEAGVPAPSNPPARALAVPLVKIGNQNATVTFAGLAPGQIGIYQVNAIVPSGLKSGSQPVTWVGSEPGAAATWVIWVK